MKLSDRIKIIERKFIKDERGWFLKLIDGKEDNLPAYTGEIYLTMALPGESKGGHYHNCANEWFTLIDGECMVQLADINSQQTMEFVITAGDAKTIYVPNGIAHNFKNIGSTNFILHAYTDQLYKPEDTIHWLF